MFRLLRFTLVVGSLLPRLVFAQADEAPSASSAPASAVARVSIDRLDPGAAGNTVEVTLRVLSSEGEPIEKLSAADLRVWQSDVLIDPEGLELLPLALAERPLSSVFVLDRSDAISDESFDQAVQTALNFVERASQREEVAVVAFADQVEVVVPFGTGHSEIRSRLQALKTQPGSSAIVFDAVLRAIELLRATSARGDGVVILLSPGSDTGPGSAARAVEASKGREGESQIPIFAIADLRATPAQMGALRALAEESGGSAAQLAARDFNSSVNRIWRQMSRGYLLRFPAEMDGGRHRVDVEIGGKIGSAKAAYPRREVELPGPALVLGALLLLAISAGAGWVAYLHWPRPARLVVLNGSQAGNVIRLKSGCQRVGSLPDNEVYLASPGVSRYHAEITVEDSRVLIRDLESKNGTRVNGVKREISPLLPGDRLEFADVRVVYEKGPRTKDRKTSER